ncbi:MAG: hypothetical protein WBP45_07915, partial [Daejeonella sp.]
MSSEFPFSPSGADDPELDPFASLDIFQHDPKFAEILEELEALQSSFNLSEEDSERYERIYELNKKIDLAGWLGDKVFVTGKLRLTSQVHNNNFDTAYFQNKGLKFQEDSQGAYCEVSEFPLMLALIDIDEP